MRMPTNTTEETRRNPMGFLLDAMMGGSSRAIENQESRGQRELVNSESLPIRMNGARPVLEAAGFKFAEHDGKDLFIECEMPKGWKKVPTDHSMWSKLLDDKGRERAKIFYKAAFYDRDAFLNLTNRFSVRKDYTGSDATGATVRDGDTVLHTIPFPPPLAESSDRGSRLARYEEEDRIVDDAKAWLTEQYPDWGNPAAYWD